MLVYFFVHACGPKHKGNFIFNLPKPVLAAFAPSCEIQVSGELSGEVSEKQKKSNDQRAPVTMYCQI